MVAVEYLLHLHPGYLVLLYCQEKIVSNVMRERQVKHSVEKPEATATDVRKSVARMAAMRQVSLVSLWITAKARDYCQVTT
jgi:hypothetical protein